ncbi:hypothetical protein ElyMa_002396300 [Elysia marginata]|uniref:Uncharacterized protein n=1 Tax=Elysia marginata TaxID=1093978 RepID=A0AAV4GEU0_9GAST|nr:hypothetical protein ElyMa_002396300 [Elysia marginata]
MSAPPLTPCSRRADVAGALVCACLNTFDTERPSEIAVRADHQLTRRFLSNPSRRQAASRTMTRLHRTLIRRRDGKGQQELPRLSAPVYSAI